MSEKSLPVWKEVFPIRYAEVTRAETVRLDTLFDYMQETAANHAENLGCGLAALNDRGMMWVLSRLKLSVLRTPCLGETVTVESWPSGVEKLFATREFVLSCGSEIVAKASSYWLLLDRGKLRPLRVLDALAGLLPDNRERGRFFTGLDKLSRRPCSSPIEVEVHESMVDVNCHMNNARYITQLFDWLALRLARLPEIREIQANFVAGTAPGSRLSIAGCDSGSSWYIEESVAGLPHFQAEVREREQ